MTITSTPAAEKLATALTENPGRTTAELAKLAGIGKSTAGKLLAAWQADGQAFRGGTMGAARWTSPASNAAAIADGAVDLSQPDSGGTDAEIDAEPGETTEVVTTAAEQAHAALDADDQDGLVEALLEMGVPASDPVPELAEQLRALDPATAAERLDEIAEANTKDSELAAAQAAAAEDADVADAEAEPVESAEPKQRLRPGGLRGMVEQWLADNPDTEISPSKLGKILDRSSGAVANALATLTDAEVVVRTSDKPKRYQLATDES